MGVLAGIRSREKRVMAAKNFNTMIYDPDMTTVSTGFWDNVIHSMQDSLIVLDTRGHIVRVNPATLRLLGYTETELLGQPASVIVQDDSLSWLSAQDYENYVVDESTETIYLTKKGQLRAMLYTVALLRSNSGDIQGLVVVAHDLNGAQQVQAALIQKTRHC